MQPLVEKVVRVLTPDARRTAVAYAAMALLAFLAYLTVLTMLGQSAFGAVVSGL